MVRRDRIRQMLVRPVVQAGTGDGVFMVAAIACFQAAAWQKGLLAAGITIGFLVAPFLLSLASRRGWRANRALAGTLIGGALGLSLVASTTWLPLYLVGVLVCLVSIATGVPMATALWRQNVDAVQRGALFSGVAWTSAVVVLGAGLLISWYMGEDPWRYRGVAGVGAIALLGAAWATLGMPAEPLRAGGRNPLAVLSLLWTHPLFGYIALCWYFLGIANLATIPLRAEYLTNPVHGIGYAPGTVLLLTYVVPLVCELISMRFWGWCFDRMNFLVVRIAINCCFFTSIALFFWPDPALQIAGAALFGLGRGGGHVVWNLWVTKIAAPERTADYMAVHTFLTGTRGVIGPMLAFLLLEDLGLHTITFSMVGSAVVATVMLLPVLRYGRFEQQAERDGTG